jgi:hypothetical protein
MTGALYLSSASEVTPLEVGHGPAARPFASITQCACKFCSGAVVTAWVDRDTVAAKSDAAIQFEKYGLNAASSEEVIKVISHATTGVPIGRFCRAGDRELCRASGGAFGD